MQLLDIDPQSLARRIRNLETQMQAQATNTQPVIADWVALAPTDYTINVADSVFPISYLTANSNILQSGYKIRLKQTGDSDYRYFYVAERSGNATSIYAGDDYTLDTGLAIEEMSYSAASSPSGHPIVFNYEPDVKTTIADITVDTANVQFYMIGSLVLADIYITDATFPAGLSNFSVTHAWIKDINFFQDSVTYSEFTENAELITTYTVSTTAFPLFAPLNYSGIFTLFDIVGSGFFGTNLATRASFKISI